MADPNKRKPDAAPPPSGDKARKNQAYDQQVEDTFPASDPPADSEPGGGITGPEPKRKRGEQR
jgi:hypothetical protein